MLPEQFATSCRNPIRRMTTTDEDHPHIVVTERKHSLVCIPDRTERRLRA